MAKKRANGEGSIRKRADGLWEARVVVGVDYLTGKTKRKSVYGKTQAEVRKKMVELKDEASFDVNFDPAKATVSEMMEKWLKVHTQTVSTRTKSTYYTRYNKGIAPYIGHVKIDNLTGSMIANLYKRLSEEEGLCDSTIQMTHMILSTAFRYYIEVGLLKRNPCKNIAKNTKHGKKKPLIALVDNNLKIFMNAIDGAKDENLYKIYLFTGLRETELLGLTWDKIDFNARTIVINQQLRRPIKGERYRLAATKNKGTRTLYPPDIVFDILIAQREKQKEMMESAGEEWDDHGIPNLVFTTRTGKYRSVASVQYHFKKIVSAAGIKEARIHDLRHAYASMSISAGVNVKFVQEALGHASAAFTLNRYTDVTDKMRNDHVTSLNNIATQMVCK